ncbi:MAG TPA: hypothetical protein VFJ77_08280 [Gaiellaceae bacterium]|nr:hypothetical protein [Gaiellaceae bacterium]
MSVRVRGEAAEVALAETLALLAAVADGERRERLGSLVAALQEGEVDGDEEQALEEILELGLATGRLRARYGPEGEQAALKLHRRLPAGRALADGAAEVTASLGELEGRQLEQVSIRAAGPGDFVLTLGVDGLELSVRLDRAGVRLHSVAV